MENAKAFLKAVAADENLAKALSEVKSREEFMKFAANHGHDLTEQDLNDLAKIGNAYLKQQTGEPLSDEELELVSGGLFLELAIALTGLAMGVIGVTAGTMIITGEVVQKSKS